MRDPRIDLRRSPSGIVRLSSATVSVLLAHRQVRGDLPEAGGLLLGRFFPDTADMVVDEASAPSASDRRSRFSIFRRKKDAQKLVDEAWAMTHGTRNFLGEWHTHPEPIPSPSCRDRLNWQRICRAAVYEQDALVFVIVGTEEMRAWEVRRNGSVFASPQALIVSDGS